MQSVQGTIHVYSGPSGPKLTCFEFGQEPLDQVVLFVAGLTDGYMSVPYLDTLSNSLKNLGWGLVQAHIRSSYFGYGVGSLDKDIDDLSKCVSFLRTKSHKRKVVLMGHSTGSQNVVHYLLSNYTSGTTAIDAGIAQAPVSDREGMLPSNDKEREKWERWLSKSSELIKNGNSRELMEREAGDATGGAPITAYRFNSLIGIGGDDDYFSSDLPAEKIDATWAGIAAKNIPILILEGEKDEYVPTTIDKVQLISSWRNSFTKWFKEENQNVIGKFVIVKGANHKVDGKEAQTELVNYVVDFLMKNFKPKTANSL